MQIEGPERRLGARIGLVVLNLVVPGLGLLRLQRWSMGKLFLILPFILLAVLTFGVVLIPITSYAHAIAALAALAGSMLALYAVPAVLTWRWSKFVSPAARWSRWYGLCAIAVAAMILLQLAQVAAHGFYKPFYAPSESMAPTIGRSDKFVADMRWRGPLRRGQIVLFRGPDGIRVSRIAAVAGDTIVLRDGVPIVNGTPAARSREGTAVFLGFDGEQTAPLVSEQLPGEAARHHVLATEPGAFDDTEVFLVPPRHVFVLGDNRGRAADSRAPRALNGAGMVPDTALIGRPLYIHWSRNRASIGRRLDS